MLLETNRRELRPPGNLGDIELVSNFISSDEEIKNP